MAAWAARAARATTVAAVLAASAANGPAESTGGPALPSSARASGGLSTPPSAAHAHGSVRPAARADPSVARRVGGRRGRGRAQPGGGGLALEPTRAFGRGRGTWPKPQARPCRWRRERRGRREGWSQGMFSHGTKKSRGTEPSTHRTRSATGGYGGACQPRRTPGCAHRGWLGLGLGWGCRGGGGGSLCALAARASSPANSACRQISPGVR